VFRSLLLISVAIAVLAFAGPALAADFTSSQITSPGDNSVVTQNADNPNMLHVTGTTAGGDSNADLGCYFGTTRRLLASNITVTGNAFSTDISLDNAVSGSPNPYCVMRAVPTGNTTVFPPDGADQSFAGPRVMFGETQTRTVGGTGPNKDVVYDFFVGQAQTQGYMDFLSFGDCALDYSFIFAPITLAQSSALFYCNGWAWNTNGCETESATCSAATQSELRVDGKNAYSPGSAYYLYYIDATHTSRILPGFPPLTFSQAIDPLTGNAHITESDPIVKCSPNQDAFHPAENDPAWNADCTSFIGAGVKLDRTLDSDQDGRRTRMIDVITNTDSVSHDVEILYDEEFSGDGTVSTAPSFAYSWMNAGSFARPTVGQTIQGPGGSGPGTVFADGNGDAADKFDFPQGAVTVSPAPTAVRWHELPDGRAYGTFRFAQTIPAGATATVYRTYVQGDSKESVASQAAAEQDRLGKPAVTITNPANGSSTNNPAVNVTGTATDPGGAVTALTVNGQAVPVAADGTWTKAMTLAAGENTIAAEASDAAGNKGSASVKVTFTPPVVVDRTAPVLGLAVAKIKLAALLARGLPVTVTCSEPCTFAIVLTTDSKRLRSVRAAKAVTIGKASGSLATAGKKQVRVKLNRKAKKALRKRKVKKVVIKVRTTATDKAGNSATKTKRVTVKRRR
jgi:hypothetical protein